MAALDRADGETPFKPATRIAVTDGFWEINGKPTCEGTDAEGLLLNVRMVHATFEDRNDKTRPKDFDADRNTAAFLGKLGEYVDHGVLAFTLCLQGGDPGYAGALCSAYEADGTLREAFVGRVARVIEACDRLGAAVILQCFHYGRDQILRDAEAVRRAVRDTSTWIHERGYTNVLLEIAGDHANRAYDHDSIRKPDRCAALIKLARKTAPTLLVTASGSGTGRVAHQISSAADLVMLRFNETPVARIQKMVVKASKVSKAVVCNDDARSGKDAVAALDACVSSLCSWGYANREKNERYPFVFEGARDDAEVYRRMRKLTRRR